MACDGVLYHKKRKNKNPVTLAATFSYSPLSMYNSKTQFSFDFV